MIPVILTAFGVGLSTLVGALFGFLFKNASHKFNDLILGFAAGIMLCASVVGLVIPSISLGGKFGIIICVVGIFLGAISLSLIDKFTPHLHNLLGTDAEKHPADKTANKILLFIFAIAIHNLPEGVAAGVGFGTENNAHAISVALGIALQNIPEGMVIIAPLLALGVSKKRTILIASLTGAVEVIGTFIGYFAVVISKAILPFALAFAGGTMLYVISDELIPETHSHGVEREATYALLIGFSLMLVLDFLIA